MTHPHITLTIEQARQIHKTLDQACEKIESEYCAHISDSGHCGPDNNDCSAQEQYQALKILSTELECLRYL